MRWGVLAIINLHGCDKSSIRNKRKIEQFIKDLCKKINMRPVGSPVIKRCGKGGLEGYSAFQFIETSSITIHFDEAKNRAFIDIFSCKKFSAKKAAEFSREFFKAKKTKTKTLIRK